MRVRDLAAILLCALLSIGASRAQTQTFLPVGPGLLTELIEISDLPLENWQVVSDVGASDLDAYVIGPVAAVTLSDLYAFTFPRSFHGRIESVTLAARCIEGFFASPPHASWEFIASDPPLVASVGSSRGLGTTWTSYSITMAFDPITGNPWNQVRLRRMQFGLRTTGLGGAGPIAGCTLYTVTVSIQ